MTCSFGVELLRHSSKLVLIQSKQRIDLLDVNLLSFAVANNLMNAFQGRLIVSHRALFHIEYPLIKLVQFFKCWKGHRLQVKQAQNILEWPAALRN